MELEQAAYALDATTIDLCLSLFPWAKFRTTKNAVKLHVKLNHAGYLPNFAIATEGRVHEQKAAWEIPLEKGDVTVFDKAYNNLVWLQTLENAGIFFITRLKDNADYHVVDRRDVSGFEHISSDHAIEMTGYFSRH